MDESLLKLKDDLEFAIRDGQAAADQAVMSFPKVRAIMSLLYEAQDKLNAIMSDLDIKQLI